MRRARPLVTFRPAQLVRLGLPAAMVAATLVAVTGSAGTAELSAEPRPIQASFRPGTATGPEYDAKSVLVKFKPKATGWARKAALAKAGGTASGPVADDVVTVSSNGKATDLLKKVKADPAVELASLNYIRRKSATPNDLYYTNYQKYLPTVRMNQAWDLSKSAGNQVVAVLDTGVDTGHPDLAGHLLPGYNTFNTALAPIDGDGHGTAVAGIIAAGTGNGIGVAGVAWNAKIRPVKVLDDNGYGSDGKLIMGINWAVKYGARVINLSLDASRPNPLLHEAIQNAVAKGVLVVAAAGNTGDGEFPQYPAAYPEVLSVGAVNRNGVLTSFSTWNSTVDIAAPGYDLASTAPRAQTPVGYQPYFVGLSGTSFASPIVAGVAALVRNKWPSLTPAQVIARLKATARDAGPRGTDPYYGAGILDAYYALGGTWAPDFAPGSADTDDQPARATAIDISRSASGNIGTEGDVDWYKVTTSTPSSVCIDVAGPLYDSEQYAQNFGPVLSVYNPALKPLGRKESPRPSVDGNGMEQPARLGVGFAVDLPAGTSYFTVRNYNGSRDSRSYNFEIYYCTANDVGGAMNAYPVLDALPADQSGGAPVDTKPSVTFAQAVLAETVTPATVWVENVKTGSKAGATVAYDETTRKATITPTTPLLDNTPYRIVVGPVEDANSNYLVPFSSLFTTADLAPTKPEFAASGAYLAANLSWKLPVMSDLDQVIVRRNAGSTVPTLTTGTLVYAGTASAIKNTGLAQNTTYTYAAWVKDRSGKVSPVAIKQLLGMKSGIATTSTLITYGGSVTIKGSTLRIDNKAYAGLPVNVYVRPKNVSTFKLLAALKTSSTGTLSIAHKPAVSSVYMLTFPGNTDLMGTRSADITVQVTPTISAALAPSAIRLGGTTKFSGYVAPAHYGKPVYLQQYSNKTWTSIASVKLSSSGAYAFGIKPSIRGQIAYRVWFPADADHAQAFTPNKILTIN
ncbi:MULTISPECIES: S8 family serine peptidase [unclassified Kribbella]|uniref:S8 family serine peptidase n=1 Tax=unclassified Kribbella TaxID=2644121 RepID=UPI0030170FC1